MRPVPKAKRWRTRLAVRRGRRLHYQGWDAWRQTSWPKRHGATRTTVIQARQLGSGASHLLGGGGGRGRIDAIMLSERSCVGGTAAMWRVRLDGSLGIPLPSRCRRSGSRNVRA